MWFSHMAAQKKVFRIVWKFIYLGVRVETSGLETGWRGLVRLQTSRQLCSLFTDSCLLCPTHLPLRHAKVPKLQCMLNVQSILESKSG